MDIGNKLKELLRSHFPKVKKQVFKEIQVINKLPKPVKALGEKEEKLILNFLTYEDDESLRKLTRELLKKKTPYLLIQKLLDSITVKIFERVAIENEVSQKETLLLRKRFKRLEQEVAKAYIVKEIEELKEEIKSNLNKYALYRAHALFIEKVVKSVKEEKFKELPIENYNESPFRKSIFYPESIMACMNAYFCDYLENLEKTAYKTAKTFFILTRKGNFSEAYLAFKELKEIAVKVSNKLAELYLLAFTNSEANFIKLVEYLSEIYPERFVAALDFSKLKSLNKLLSEEKVNRILEKAQEAVESSAREKIDKLLVVRGISHNFLILGVNLKEKEFKENLQEVKELIKKLLKEEGIEVDFRIYGFLLNDTFTEFENRVIDFLHFVKEKAKKERKELLLITEEEKLKELLNWKRKQFRKISFVKEKIKNGEIEVVFQPIVESKEFEVVALETLFRIVDGEALISPGIFIDVIYQLNLITEVDIAVLEKIKELKELIKEITNKLFINISPISLSSKEFLKELNLFMEEMGKFEIYLEITEQKILENSKELKELAEKYRNLKFAIDDFGSGYSSFKLVIDLAENETLGVIKLDGSYTKKAQKSKFTRKAVNAIASLARSLEVKTVAEFVESEELVEILRKEGIDYLQGYYISKPKTIEEIIYEAERTP
ncbi:EAL domain-containing protein [Thermovibrio sp.]